MIYASNPSEVDYTAYGIENALVIDNTGKWRDAEGLAQLLKCPGAARVILTAPGKGDMKNVVFGVNQADILDEDQIIFCCKLLDQCDYSNTESVKRQLHSDQWSR